MLRKLNTSLNSNSSGDNNSIAYSRDNGERVALDVLARENQFEQLYQAELLASICIPSRTTGYFPKLLGLDKDKLKIWFNSLRDGAAIKWAAISYDNTEEAHTRVVENRKNFGVIGASFAATNLKGDNLLYHLKKTIKDIISNSNFSFKTIYNMPRKFICKSCNKHLITYSTVFSHSCTGKVTFNSTSTLTRVLYLHDIFIIPSFIDLLGFIQADTFIFKKPISNISFLKSYLVKDIINQHSNLLPSFDTSIISDNLVTWALPNSSPSYLLTLAFDTIVPYICTTPQDFISRDPEHIDFAWLRRTIEKILLAIGKSKLFNNN